MSGAVKDPSTLKATDSGVRTRYFGLKASKPKAAERLSEGKKALRAASTSHLAARNWCSACCTSARCNNSCVGMMRTAAGNASCKKSPARRTIGAGKRPKSKLRWTSVSTTACRNCHSSACALANSASNFSTPNCVSASASFCMRASLTAFCCKVMYCATTANLLSKARRV